MHELIKLMLKYQIQKLKTHLSCCGWKHLKVQITIEKQNCIFNIEIYATHCPYLA
jgi:hypothetical protein